MLDHFDDKGKVFTQLVSKIGLDVIIQTTTTCVRARLHIRPENRLSDEINNAEEFIPVTNAVVHDNNGNLLYKSRMLLLNTHQIVWIIPCDEIQEGEIS